MKRSPRGKLCRVLFHARSPLKTLGPSKRAYIFDNIGNFPITPKTHSKLITLRSVDLRQGEVNHPHPPPPYPEDTVERPTPSVGRFTDRDVEQVLISFLSHKTVHFVNVTSYSHDYRVVMCPV